MNCSLNSDRLDDSESYYYQSSLYLRSTLPEPLQPRPPRHQTLYLQRIHNYNIYKTKHQTPTKNKTIVHPRIALIQTPYLAYNCPRQNIQQITRQALVQIPFRLRRQHNARELRRHGIKYIAPIDRPPHVRRDLGNLLRIAQILREGPRTPERQGDGDRNLDRYRDAYGEELEAARRNKAEKRWFDIH